MSFWGIPIEFIIFAVMLVCIAVFYQKVFGISLSGMLLIVVVKLCDPTFNLDDHIARESHLLVNLFGFLMGFALLTRHFEISRLPERLPAHIPKNWVGGVALLGFVFVISSFIENIAACLIGGTMAGILYRHKVHIAYLAALIAAANAGGTGSVVGDTTTTMMWIDGIHPLDLIEAYIGSLIAFAVFAVPASLVQSRHIAKGHGNPERHKVVWSNMVVVVLTIVGAIIANILWNFPALGVWCVLLAGAVFAKTDWTALDKSLKGSVFLIALVFSASLMPVDRLPPASTLSTFVLGLLSVFGNIPLTKLALEQGGYDWALLSYAVGFGGSMLWFGSSAGVGLSNMYPQVRATGEWIKYSWPVLLSYIAGFCGLYVYRQIAVLL